MKNPMPLLADFITNSNQRNGVQHTPTLRARMKYGARLKRMARGAEREMQELLCLTRKRGLESQLD
jgi:hypothetical protein